VSAGAAFYPVTLFLCKKHTFYLLAVPQGIQPGIMPQAVGCITIQALRNHQRNSGRFLWV